MKNSIAASETSANSLTHFEYVDHEAQSVCIAGTFNNWHPSATPMISCGPSVWKKDLALSPGIYEYALVVDGHWKLDPHCTEKTENPFGGMNSVLRVGSLQACCLSPVG